MKDYLKRFSDVTPKTEGNGATIPKEIPWEYVPLLLAIDKCESREGRRERKGKNNQSGLLLSFYSALREFDSVKTASNEESPPERTLFSVFRDTDSVYQQVVSMDVAAKILGDRIRQLLAIIAICSPDIRPEILYTAGQQLDVIIATALEQTSERKRSDVPTLLQERWLEAASGIIDSQDPPAKVKENSENAEAELFSLFVERSRFYNFTGSLGAIFERLNHDRKSVAHIEQIPPDVLEAIRKTCEKGCDPAVLSEARRKYDAYRVAEQPQELTTAAKEFNEALEATESLLNYSETIFGRHEQITMILLTELKKMGIEPLVIRNYEQWKNEGLNLFVDGKNRGLSALVLAEAQSIYQAVNDAYTAYLNLAAFCKAQAWSGKKKSSLSEYSPEFFYFRAAFVKEVMLGFEGLVKDFDQDATHHGSIERQSYLFYKRHHPPAFDLQEFSHHSLGE